MALYLPVQVQVKANENMIPNNMQQVAATVAIPLSKLAELAIILAGTVWTQVEYFASI